MYYNLRNIIDYIKKEPLKFFALVYPYVLTIIILVGLIYVNNLNLIERKTVMPRAQDSTMQGDLKVIEAKSIPPMDLNLIAKPSEQIIQDGKTLFNKVCVSCHGEDGKGTGPGAAGLNPAPRNFTSNDNWKNGPKFSGIYKTLEEGIPGSAMISYDYLTPQEKVGLAHYIRNTFVQNAPPVEQGEVQNLDQTYNITKGKEIPSQIPVKDAEQILISERNKNINISALQNKIKGNRNERGAKILTRITKNDEISLLWLMNNKNILQTEKEFRSNMTRFVEQNGFNDRIYGLSSGEWVELYNYINKIMGKGNEV
ncbi:MAG TPA: cytochrome c [Ignavibacteriaceae bacterium]|nr:cytochrome c [Ignavibacteriaceae bacterium]